VFLKKKKKKKIHDSDFGCVRVHTR